MIGENRAEKGGDVNAEKGRRQRERAHKRDAKRGEDAVARSSVGERGEGGEDEGRKKQNAHTQNKKRKENPATTGKDTLAQHREINEK